MSQTIVPSTEKLVASGDGRLATQAFGDPSDPAVLLIKGQMASMLWWPEPSVDDWQIAAGS